MLKRTLLATGLLLALGGCGKGESPPAAPGDAAPDDAAHTRPAATVDSSGKSAAELAEVPAAVLDAARQARPGITLLEAEYETRDGREYYDIGGVLPDDAEVELDLTRIDGRWTVVEIQRDIGPAELPAGVAQTLAAAVPGWEAARIIESDQGDGTVIYEFFGAGDDPVKYEIKWAAGVAEFLTEEWAH